LTGYNFLLTHLDERIVKVNSEPGDVIKPGDIRLVAGEGMPKYKSPFEKGGLYIVFDIEFPTYEQIKPNIKEIQKLLPAPNISKKRKTQNVIDEVVAKTFKMEQEIRKDKSSKRKSQESDGSNPDVEEGHRYHSDEGRCNQQ